MSNDTKNRKDIEKIVLISFQNSENFDFVVDKGITPDHFSPGVHREIFEIYSSYYYKYNQALTPDVLEDKANFSNYPRDKKNALIATYKSYLKQKATSNLEYYCDRLNDLLAGNIFVETIEEAENLAESGEDNRTILSNIVNNINSKRELFDNETTRKSYSAYELCEILDSEMKKRRDYPELYQGAKTGIKYFDEAFHPGLRDGELTLFMAAPGHGKTTAMLTISDALWRKSHKNVMYFSLEMPFEALAFKHLAAQSSVNVDDLEAGILDEGQLERVNKAFEEREEIENNLGFYHRISDISACGRVPASAIETEIKKYVNYGNKPDVVFVDYLELVDPQTGNDDIWISYGDVCKFLRGLGRKYGFSVVSAVQLKRAAIERMRKSKSGEYTFGAEDAQGSNQISADSDRMFVGVLKDNTWNLYTAKNRFGSPKEFKFYFDGLKSKIYMDGSSYESHEPLASLSQLENFITTSDDYNEDEDDDLKGFN